jgi:hypothetical protein
MSSGSSSIRSSSMSRASDAVWIAAARRAAVTHQESGGDVKVLLHVCAQDLVDAAVAHQTNDVSLHDRELHHANKGRRSVSNELNESFRPSELEPSMLALSGIFPEFGLSCLPCIFA